MPATTTARREPAAVGTCVGAGLGLLLAVAAWGWAQGAAEPAAPIGTEAQAADNSPVGARALNCVVDAALPDPPETAAEGGFAFVYQALGGVATDGRACTVHRLMNTAGGPPTPVRWRAGDELLVEMARLARCGEEAACQWFEVARYFDGGFGRGPSRLGFGLNADAFGVDTDSLVAVTDPDLGAVTASVGTEVAGTVVTADGRSLTLAFTVKSRLERRDAGAMSLVYEVVTSSPELLPGGELALRWQALDLTPEAAAAARSDDGSPFLVTEPVGGPAGTALEGPDGYRLEVTVQELEYAPALSLSLVERSRPEDALLVLPMPAFVPGG